MAETALDWKIEHYEFRLKLAENALKKQQNSIKKLKKQYTTKQLKTVANNNVFLNYSPGRYLDVLIKYSTYQEKQVKEYKKILTKLRKLR